MKKKHSVFWMRRDLRLNDNAALYHALQSGNPVICFFIFDTDILNELNCKDARVSFIHQKLEMLNRKLQDVGSRLVVANDTCTNAFKNLLNEFSIEKVFANKDYEPLAKQRDQEILDFLNSKTISFQLYKDQVIFEEKEIVKKDESPYTVYTPYMKKWREYFNSGEIKEYSIHLSADHFIRLKAKDIPSLSSIGFKKSSIVVPPFNLSDNMLENYNDKRNFPALKATSGLGPHLRFGTISIRQAVKKALNGHSQFLNELIWRDFFMQILNNFPRVVQQSFKRQYDELEWRNNEKEFTAWCKGKTGYPMVDAGMRELKATGNMHNRVRMLVASFLCKHLLIDWRLGEAWFANLLLDYDLAANNGNWQWAAGCGCDAAPYFRIFNPYEQQKKFDPNMEYIQKWVPEFNTSDYPKPIVDHKFARQRALDAYKKALQ